MKDNILKELLNMPDVTLSKEFLYASMFAKIYESDTFQECAKTSVEKQIDMLVDIQFSKLYSYDIVEYVNHDELFDLIELKDIKKWLEDNDN